MFGCACEVLVPIRPPRRRPPRGEGALDRGGRSQFRRRRPPRRGRGSRGGDRPEGGGPNHFHSHHDAQHFLQTGGALQCRLVPRSLDVSVVDDDVVRPVPRRSLLRQVEALSPCAIIGPWLQLLRPDLLAIFGHRKLLHARGRCEDSSGRIMFLRGGVASRLWTLPPSSSLGCCCTSSKSTPSRLSAEILPLIHVLWSVTGHRGRTGFEIFRQQVPFFLYNFDSRLKGTFRNAAINIIPSLFKRAGP